MDSNVYQLVLLIVPRIVDSYEYESSIPGFEMFVLDLLFLHLFLYYVRAISSSINLLFISQNSGTLNWLRSVKTLFAPEVQTFIMNGCFYL